MFHCKPDKTLLADALLKFQKHSIRTCGLDLWNCVFLPGEANEWKTREWKQDLGYIQDKEIYFRI